MTAAALLPRRSRLPGLRLITESELEGNFRGWNGGTEFLLSNGEVWKQAAYRCRQVYLCCPRVRIWRIGPSFLLELEGVPEVLPVVRMR